MEYNPYEVDHIDISTCPYNNNHRFEGDITKFTAHIARCKDAKNPHVQSRVRKCAFSVNHIFTDEASYKYHIPRCPNHENRSNYLPAKFGEAPRMIEYLKCSFNSNHWVLPEAIENHHQTCPNRQNKRDHRREIAEIQLKGLDNTPIGFRNRCHGHLATEELVESQPTQRVRLSTEFDSYTIGYRADRNIMLHYCNSSFSVLKAEVQGRSLPERHLYIDRLTYANYVEWPGLQQIEERRNYGDFMVATLHKDKEDKSSSTFYDMFIENMSKRTVRTFKIATCSQAAGSEDLIFFIVHKEEPGFGNHIYNADLGVFCFGHSVLYSRPNRITEIQRNLEETRESLRNAREELNKIPFITQSLDAANLRIIELEDQKGKLEEEYLNSFEKVQVEFKGKITKAKSYMIETAQFYEKRIKKEQEENDWKERDIHRKIRNLEAELADSRSKQEINVQEALSKVNDLQESYDREKFRNSGLEKQLHEKIEQNNQLSIELDTYRNRSIHLENNEELQEIIRKRELEVREKLIEEMRDNETCRMCLQEKKNTVFIPCGHLLYCNCCLDGLGIPLNKNLSRSRKSHRCECCANLVEKVIHAFAYC